ncbi:MAG: HAMP domain-containing protein [Candidatus Omnitrophica bacterium]|nr:HAMP domain-containing protein [Candidatus Omnitrophota bacterium]
MTPSIRVTLTFWYIGILAVILCLFSWIFYTRVDYHLNQNVNERLISQADGVADTLFAFWQAEWQAKHRSTPQTRQKKVTLYPKSFQREVQYGRFPGLVSRWAVETKILETADPFRILQKDGKETAASKSFEEIRLPSLGALPEEWKQGVTLYQDFRESLAHVRLATRPVMEDGRLLYFVQTAALLGQETKSLGELRTWIFLLVPSMLVLTSVGGWFLATLALRPVGKMITQAQKIGAARLNERLDVPATKDELERLAETFNEMLSRLDRAFKRLRQFSAAASHELRTPLTIMKGELELALKRPRDPEEYKRVMGTQLEALNEMAAIVEQLLLLARSEEGEEGIEWKPVELGGLAEEIGGDWKVLAEQKQVRLAVLSAEKLWVRGETQLLKRLLANLLDNAVKHTPPGGEVTLETKEENRQACVVVRDTGPGIPPEEMPVIFDKFFTKRSGGHGTSTGLGLGLCRWIVEAHKGRMEVTSSPGQGAVFTIWLPGSPSLFRDGR